MATGMISESGIAHTGRGPSLVDTQSALCT